MARQPAHPEFINLPAEAGQRGKLWPHVAMAALALAGSFTFNVGGNIYGSELFALLALPFVGFAEPLARYRGLRVVIVGFAIVAVGLLIADVVNQTPFFNAVRGWANPAFAVVLCLFFVATLDQNHRAIEAYFLASFLAMLVFGNAGYALRGTQVDLALEAILYDANSFKIRFVPFILPALYLLTVYTYRFGMWFNAALLTVAGILFLALDARSSGLCLLVAAALVVWRAANIQLTLKTALLCLVPILVLGELAYVGYVRYSLVERPEGHNSAQLAYLDNPYNPFELLLQGRADIIGAAYAIADRPVTGHGSWASDPSGYYLARMAEQTHDASVFERIEDDSSVGIVIPAHSVLLGFWVWGGILGFAGILVMFAQTLASARAALSQPGPYYAAAAVMLVGVVWDILFSPNGAIRLSVPPALALLMIMAQANAGKLANHRSGR